MTQTIPPVRAPSRVWLITAVTVGLVLIGPLGFLLGSHSRQGAIDSRDDRLQVCDSVTAAMYKDVQLLYSGMEALNSDASGLSQLTDELQAHNAALDQQFGTHDLPSIMRRCTVG